MLCRDEIRTPQKSFCRHGKASIKEHKKNEHLPPLLTNKYVLGTFALFSQVLLVLERRNIGLVFAQSDDIWAIFLRREQGKEKSWKIYEFEAEVSQASFHYFLHFFFSTPFFQSISPWDLKFLLWHRLKQKEHNLCGSSTMERSQGSTFPINIQTWRKTTQNSDEEESFGNLELFLILWKFSASLKSNTTQLWKRLKMQSGIQSPFCDIWHINQCSAVAHNFDGEWKLLRWIRLLEKWTIERWLAALVKVSKCVSCYCWLQKNYPS